MTQIAIIGAGQAGAALAARLRLKGHDGAITVYGDEAAPPYQRPPLSKKFLSGEWDAERLWLRAPDFWAANDIELRLGAPVTMIDPELGHLMWNGELQDWDKLALTTGTRPRPLPPGFAGRTNVFELRSIQDVERLRPAFRAGQRLVILGGGYVGLETAAVAAQSGLQVTVIERAPRILERVACAQTADQIRSLHQGHGVTLLEGCSIARTIGAPALESLILEDGRQIDCDLVVAGVGVLPQIDLAEMVGIRCENGIRVDQYGRTSAPGIWAAGDCASFELDGLPTRLESVQNAIDQAEAVADDMLGLGQPYQPVPWFWSDQYDVKLQIVGLNRGYDTVVAAESARGRSNWYFRDERLLAVDALNDGRAYMVAKKLLDAGVVVGIDAVRHADFNPMDLMKALPAA